MGCDFVSDLSIFDFMANFLNILHRDLYICSTVHYAFECTSKQSVTVAQWSTHRTNVRGATGSMPIYVNYLFHHFVSYGEVGLPLQKSFVSWYFSTIFNLAIYHWLVWAVDVYLFCSNYAFDLMSRHNVTMVR